MQSPMGCHGVAGQQQPSERAEDRQWKRTGAVLCPKAVVSWHQRNLCLSASRPIQNRVTPSSPWALDHPTRIRTRVWISKPSLQLGRRVTSSFAAKANQHLSLSLTYVKCEVSQLTASPQLLLISALKTILVTAHLKSNYCLHQSWDRIRDFSPKETEEIPFSSRWQRIIYSFLLKKNYKLNLAAAYFFTLKFCCCFPKHVPTQREQGHDCSTEKCGQAERDPTAYDFVISHILIIKKINNILAIRYR